MVEVLPLGEGGSSVDGARGTESINGLGLVQVMLKMRYSYHYRLEQATVLVVVEAQAVVVGVWKREQE